MNTIGYGKVLRLPKFKNGSGRVKIDTNFYKNKPPTEYDWNGRIVSTKNLKECPIMPLPETVAWADEGIEIKEYMGITAVHVISYTSAKVYRTVEERIRGNLIRIPNVVVIAGEQVPGFGDPPDTNPLSHRMLKNENYLKKKHIDVIKFVFPHTAAGRSLGPCLPVKDIEDHDLESVTTASGTYYSEDDPVSVSISEPKKYIGGNVLEIIVTDITSLGESDLSYFIDWAKPREFVSTDSIDIEYLFADHGGSKPLPVVIEDIEASTRSESTTANLFDSQTTVIQGDLNDSSADILVDYIPPDAPIDGYHIYGTYPKYKEEYGTNWYIDQETIDITNKLLQDWSKRCAYYRRVIVLCKKNTRDVAAHPDDLDRYGVGEAAWNKAIGACGDVNIVIKKMDVDPPVSSILDLIDSEIKAFFGD